MKRARFLALLVPVALAACSSGTPSATKHPTAAEIPSYAKTPEQKYIAALESAYAFEHGVVFPDDSHADLIQFGDEVCADMRARNFVNGQTVTVAEWLRDQNFTGIQAVAIGKYAAQYLCPDAPKPTAD